MQRAMRRLREKRQAEKRLNDQCTIAANVGLRSAGSTRVSESAIMMGLSTRLCDGNSLGGPRGGDSAGEIGLQVTGDAKTTQYESRPLERFVARIASTLGRHPTWGRADAV